MLPLLFLMVNCDNFNNEECKVILNSITMDSHSCFEDDLTKYIFDDVFIKISTKDSLLLKKNKITVLLKEDTLVFKKAHSFEDNVIHARMVQSSQGLIFEKRYQDLIDDLSNDIYIDGNLIEISCSDSVQVSFLYKGKSLDYIIKDKEIMKFQDIDEDVICD